MDTAQPGGTAHPAGTPRREARILVADDDEDVRDIVRAKLSRAGHDVRCVADGPTALESIRLWRPDLAVLDRAMPGLDGLDVLREVRRDPEVSETRVIMLTGHARIADRDTGIAAGADEYVFKPFSPQDLLDRVDRVLEL